MAAVVMKTSGTAPGVKTSGTAVVIDISVAAVVIATLGGMELSNDSGSIGDSGPT